jgi:cell wall-associated NlpC family hydrolase
VSHTTRSGRHRAANRYSAVAEISSIVKSAGGTGVRASAVLAASGGLVATFALPAQALPSSRSAASQSAGATAPADVLGSSHAKLAAPAVTAPEVTAPVAAEAVGVAGVKAVAKPKPKPKPEPVAEVVAQAVETRSTDTTASRSQAAPPPPPAANVPQTASGIVGIAQQYIGTPYVSGGASPSGFDCSGLTQYVFGQAGISIPRTAGAQQAAATPVSSPQPGDLVFFGYPAWHVGIYVGNGMMIDSPKPGTSVQYRSIFSGVSGYGRF